MADDFRQYYLGAYTRTDSADPTRSPVSPSRSRLRRRLGGRWSRVTTRSTRPASSSRPAMRSPSMSSRSSPARGGAVPGPGGPVRAAGGRPVRRAAARRRLLQPADPDRDGPRASAAAELQFQLSCDIEGPTTSSSSRRAPPAATTGRHCRRSAVHIDGLARGVRRCRFLLDAAPVPDHLPGRGLHAAGATGEWHALTGDTGGWTSRSPTTCCRTRAATSSSRSRTSPTRARAGVGAFVDDTHVVIDGADDADGFEGATSAWAPRDRPRAARRRPATGRSAPACSTPPARRRRTPAARVRPRAAVFGRGAHRPGREGLGRPARVIGDDPVHRNADLRGVPVRRVQPRRRRVPRGDDGRRADHRVGADRRRDRRLRAERHRQRRRRRAAGRGRAGPSPPGAGRPAADRRGRRRRRARRGRRVLGADAGPRAETARGGAVRTGRRRVVDRGDPAPPAVRVRRVVRAGGARRGRRRTIRSGLPASFMSAESSASTSRRTCGPILDDVLDARTRAAGPGP